MQAKTIAEVIDQLNDIIYEARPQEDRIGYFPALYRRVTVAVKHGIEQGVFDDADRMEHLDVVFANRYLAAFDAFQHQRPLSECWRISFEAARYPEPVLLQHLLLGINAHINLDLGLAAASLCPGDSIEELKSDFLKINLVLASLVGECIREFGKIWPVIGWGDSMLDGQEEIVVDMQMQEARNYAWNVALRFATMPAADWHTAEADLDKEISGWSQSICHPGFPVGLIFWFFHLIDGKTVAQTIRILTEKAPRVQVKDHLTIT